MDSNNTKRPNDSSTVKDEKENEVQLKKLRRQAQIRESVRKCQLRKKSYIQELEERNMKLIQLEEKYLKVENQVRGMEKGIVCQQPNENPGKPEFAETYASWLREHNKLIILLRKELNKNLADTDIKPIIDNVLGHFKEIFKLKEKAAKIDVMNIIYGSWMKPVERSIMWVGGFRSSDLIKLIMNHLELTVTQTNNLSHLKTSTIQEESNISGAINKLQESIVETLVSDALIDKGDLSMHTTYMSHMYMTIGKLSVMKNFMHQTNQLREMTLQKMNELLTTKQSALAFIAINDYFERISALSNMWKNRLIP